MSGERVALNLTSLRGRSRESRELTQQPFVFWPEQFTSKQWGVAWRKFVPFNKMTVQRHEMLLGGTRSCPEAIMQPDS